MVDLLGNALILSCSWDIKPTRVIFLYLSLSPLKIEACNIFFTHSIELRFIIHMVSEPKLNSFFLLPPLLN